MTTIDRAAVAIEECEIDVNESIPIAFARAVLAAIDEPSEKMIEAGEDALSFVQTDDARSVWRAMHKAMMEEK